MLIEFRIKNFKSFKDEQVLSMVASADKSLPDNTISTSISGLPRLLRSVVVYGANASGKSNLINAIGFVQDFVSEIIERKPGAAIPVRPFLLDPATKGQPSEFEITFIHEHGRYQYGFAVDQQRVHKEWLIAYPKGLPQRWFERTYNQETNDYYWYSGPKLLGEKRKLQELTRPDVLFLSVAATFNHKQLSTVHTWFADNWSIMGLKAGMLKEMTAILAMDDENFHKSIQVLLQLADIGIADFTVVKKPEQPEARLDTLLDNVSEVSPEMVRSLLMRARSLDVQLIHTTGTPVDNVPFSWEDESFGTQRLFGVGGIWRMILQLGNLLAVDELDSSLHPLLVRKLVEMLHDLRINSRNAQLIFNTHDTTLLDTSLFRRDQIWFTEKDNGGASHLYSLLEFHPRKDEALERGYLQGRYGAIPFLGELTEELAVDAQKAQE